MGTPIVTWPGRFMRARVTAALYRQMDFEDLIATSAETYIQLALKLACDKEFNRQARARIKNCSEKIFVQDAAVRAMEEFFIAAHESWRQKTADPQPHAPLQEI